MQSGPQINTEFEYLYRDASNYKWFGKVVVAGRLTIDDLKKSLIDGEYFIPELVGMRSLTPDIRNEDDHDWHEIVSLKPSSQPANFLSAEELALKFKALHLAGWPYLSKEWRHG
jgi:hypothetical protein